MDKLGFNRLKNKNLDNINNNLDFYWSLLQYFRIKYLILSRFLDLNWLIRKRQVISKKAARDVNTVFTEYFPIYNVKF